MAINVGLTSRKAACDFFASVARSYLHLMLDSQTQIKMPNKQMVRLTGVDESTTIGKLKEMLSAGGGLCASIWFSLFRCFPLNLLPILLVFPFSQKPRQLLFLSCVLIFTFTQAYSAQICTVQSLYHKLWM